MNTRNNRTSAAARRNSGQDAPAPDATDQTQSADAPVNTDVDAPQVDAPVQPELDATAQPDADPTATPDTESDETVTPGDAPAEKPAPDADPATTADPTPDADDPADAAAPVDAPVPTFASLLVAATSPTTEQASKLIAFATALTVARTDMLEILANRKDDEIIQTVTVPFRPDSSSGRGPTLALLAGHIATALGGAGFTSQGNCHDSTKLRPIHANVVIPVAARPYWDAIAIALDALGGPIRYAEANVKSAARAALKAGGPVNRTIYHMENDASRRNMLETGAQLLGLIPRVAPDHVHVMRDVVYAVTQEYARVTSIAFIPKGPKYIVPPTTVYDVKAEVTPTPDQVAVSA